MTRSSVPQAEAALPHYLGHRERLRERFRTAGGGALADYELLELVLFRAIPRRDIKPLAKALLARFGSFAEVVAARPERLKEIEGLSEAAILELKIVAEAAKRFAKVRLEKRPTMGSFSALLAYCRTAMPFLTVKNSAFSSSIRRMASLPTRSKARAPSIMPLFIRAKSCAVRWS